MKMEKSNLDEVLDKFGMFQRYHLQFLVIAMCTFSYTLFFSQNYIFSVEETKYRCIDEAFINNTCGVVNGERCTQWVYDNPHSFVAEMQLACQEWKRTLVGSAHVLGYMLGLCIVGLLSDRIGRKQTLIWTGVSGAVLGALKSFCRSYWLYTSLEFLNALIGDVYSPLYVLSIEITSAKKRVIFHFLCTIGSCIGGIIFALLAWGIPYWRHLLQAIYLPGFIFITYFFLIDESPRWLLSKGKKDKAIAILEKIARKNSVLLNKEELDKLMVENEDSKINFVDLLKMSFKSPILLKRCLVCIVWWISSTFVYYGLVINIVSLEGNKYLNYGLTQIVQLPGRFVIMYILHNYKRKKPLIYSFLIGALLCFVHPFLPERLPWLSVVLYIASTITSSCFFGITYIYTSELFPTYTRNSMHALCSSVGRIGTLAAPQTPLLWAYWSGLPTLLFGGASLVAGLVTFLVPDTADDALPDTVQEAENQGKKQEDITGIDNPVMTQN